MDYGTFKTLIRSNHALSSEYARARIASLALSITGNYSTNRLLFDNKLVNGERVPERGNIVMTHKCTEEEYNEFKRNVKVLYPGLCIFNYKK